MTFSLAVFLPFIVLPLYVFDMNTNVAPSFSWFFSHLIFFYSLTHSCTHTRPSHGFFQDIHTSIYRQTCTFHFIEGFLFVFLLLKNVVQFFIHWFLSLAKLVNTGQNSFLNTRKHKTR